MNLLHNYRVKDRIAKPNWYDRQGLLRKDFAIIKPSLLQVNNNNKNISSVPTKIEDRETRVVISDSEDYLSDSDEEEESLQSISSMQA